MEKKKILLLNPVVKGGVAVLRAERCQQIVLPGMALWPPISLAYAAAVIKDLNLEILLIDAEIDGLTYDDMISRIIEFCPDMFLVQGITPAVNDDNDIARLVREKCSDVIAVIYGCHATVRPEDYLSKHYDYAIMGEPEQAFKQLVENLIKKTDHQLKDIPGLAFKTGDEIYRSSRSNTVEDLDDIPFPARDLLNNNAYFMPGIDKTFTVIKISRGCPFKCTYCTSRLYYGNRARFRSPENIFAEITEVVEKYGIKTFLFHSDTFNANKKQIMRLLDYIIDAAIDIQWLSNSRTELLDDELVAKMKEAGCYAVSLGIESGSDEILKNIKKGNTRADAERAVALLRKYRINSIGYFMLGLPGETEEKVKETIDFMIHLNPDYIQYYIATPFPGTEFFDMAMRDGWIKEMEWDRLYNGMSDVMHHPNISSERLFYYKNLAYRRFYLRPGRIFKELTRINSLPAIKNYFLTFLNFCKAFGGGSGKK